MNTRFFKSFRPMSFIFGPMICVILGAYFSYWESTSHNIFDSGIFAAILVWATVLSLLLLYRKSVNAMVIITVFFVFFYLIGLYIRPVFFPQNISMVNGVAILMAFFISIWGAYSVKGRTPPTHTRLQHSAPKKITLVLYAGLTVSVVTAVVWWGLKGGIPIFMSNINIVRTTNNYFAIRQLMFTGAVPFWYALCFPDYSYRHRYFMAVYCFIIAFILLTTGYRSFPLGFVLISFLLAFRRGYIHKIDFKTVVTVVLLGTVTISFGVLRNKQTLGSNDTRADMAIAAQTFFNRPTGLQDVSEFFPRHYPFTGPSLYGRSFGFILPGSQKGVGKWLKEDILQADFVGGGYNPGLAGEFYIVGGYYFVFTAFFFWGAAIAWGINRASFLAPRRSIAGVLVAFYFALSLSPGLSTTIVTLTYYLAVLFYVDMYMRNK